MALYNIEIQLKASGVVVGQLSITETIEAAAKKMSSEGVWIPDGSGGGQLVLPSGMDTISIVAVP